MKETLSHGIVALLYALGLTLTMLGCLDMLSYGLLASGILLAVVIVMAICSLKKWTRLTLTGVLLGGAALWLGVLGGIDTVVEILRAMTLQLTGIPAALPMVAGETVVILTLTVGVASFMLTYRGVGSYPVLAVLLLVVMTLWLSDQPEMMACLIPAGAATIAVAAMDRHEEMALRRVLPLAVIVAALSVLAVPGSGVTIEPMKKAADDLRQKIYDYFFYTEPRNVFSLASEGYYPQGQNQMGGKAEPTDHPVMVVSTTRKTYLRGSSKNEYTGRVWLDTLGGRRYLWFHPRWRDARRDAFNMTLPSGAVAENSLLSAQQVSVRMLSSSASSMFVPQRIRELNVGGDLVPYFNAASEVFATRDLQQGDTYTVSAPLMLAGDAGLGTLVSACESSSDPLYAQIAADYTTLPDHLQSQVFDIAVQASAGAERPYDKALAIQNYLSSSFRYTLDVEPQQENIDFVSSFLLSTKEGYCTYFASAMTVLCRMVGLPARYVEGYLAEPNESGVAYVTGLQGHAWTEVYFAGFGWLTFDATPTQHNSVTPPNNLEDPSGSEPSPSPESPEDEPTPSPSPEQEDTPPEGAPENEPTPTPTVAPSEPPENNTLPTIEPTDEPNQEPPREDQPMNWSWLWWLFVLAVIAAIAVRIILTQPKRQAAHAKDETARWTVWVQALHDALRVMKLQREASESPMAYMKRVDSLRRFQTELLPIGECMALVCYGHLEPEPEETAMTAQAYAQVTARMAWWQKAWLAIVRAFTPVKKRDYAK